MITREYNYLYCLTLPGQRARFSTKRAYLEMVLERYIRRFGIPVMERDN